MFSGFRTCILAFFSYLLVLLFFEVPQRMQLITVFLLLATYIPCLFLPTCFICLALSHLGLDPVLEHSVPSLMTPIDVR